MNENTGTSTAHLYIQSWIGEQNIEHNVLEIEQELIEYGQKYTVINSTDNVYDKENWINSGDNWYYVSFYNALKDFDNNSDYFVFLTGDVKVESWTNLLDRMYSVLDNKIGSYSPVILKQDNLETYYKNCVWLKDIDENLYCSVIADGVFVAIKKEIVSILLDFFDYINNNINIYDYKYGWGTDFSISTICLQEKALLIKDSLSIVYNTSIETENRNVIKVADTERLKIIELLHSFYLEKGIDITSLVSKMRQRVGFLEYPVAEPDLSLTFQDFYE